MLEYRKKSSGGQYETSFFDVQRLLRRVVNNDCYGLPSDEKQLIKQAVNCARNVDKLRYKWTSMQYDEFWKQYDELMIALKESADQLISKPDIQDVLKAVLFVVFTSVIFCLEAMLKFSLKDFSYLVAACQNLQELIDSLSRKEASPSYMVGSVFEQQSEALNKLRTAYLNMQDIQEQLQAAANTKAATSDSDMVGECSGRSEAVAAHQVPCHQGHQALFSIRGMSSAFPLEAESNGDVVTPSLRAAAI